MPSYKAPVADTMFILNEIVGLERLDNIPGFAAASSDVVQAVLEEGGKFASEVLRDSPAILLGGDDFRIEMTNDQGRIQCTVIVMVIDAPSTKAAN